MAVKTPRNTRVTVQKVLDLLHELAMEHATRADAGKVLAENGDIIDVGASWSEDIHAIMALNEACDRLIKTHLYPREEG